MMEGQKSSQTQNLVLNLTLMAVVAALMIVSVVLVRNKLLENAQEMGSALVHSYVTEEDRVLEDLQINLKLAGAYVEESISQGNSAEEIRQWLRGYFEKLGAIMGEGTFDLYAVIQGQIVAANPWEGDADYDFGTTLWYTKALEEPGQVVQTPLYEDAITGEKIMTLSMALSSPGDVVALDVYIQKEVEREYLNSLPENASLYLCDESGELIYARTQWNVTWEQLQEYANYLLEGIQDGSLLPYDATYKDLAGDERGIYHQQMENGWIMILTLPTNQILMGDQSFVVYMLAAVSVILFLILGWLTLRNALANRLMKRIDDTVHMLGDSFYAVYRVNFRNGTYEAVKVPADTQKELPPKGNYNLLIDCLKQFVKPQAYKEFTVQFSLDRILQRVKLGISDYGGDYQRRFGEKYRWVNVRTLYNKKVAPDEVIFCFRDVDDEKRLQMQHSIILSQALEEARKSTKAKTDFFSGMSHDMRTPLNAIMGFCDLAEKHEKAGEYDRMEGYIRKIRVAGQQMLSLVNDILEVSRIEAKKTTLEYTRFSLTQLLEETLGMFRDRAEADHKTMTMELQIQDDLVESDRGKLTQILNNLLSNALKYSNPGDSVFLGVRQFEFSPYHKFQFVVKDTGIGMSQSFLEHLFDPYTRETAFTSSPVVGTGLGMAIVKSYVQQLSGEIAVESQLGKGSCFTVTLPLQVVEQAPDHPQEKAPEKGKEPFQWKGFRILMAEDNQMNGEILMELLAVRGAEVQWAHDGQEAVELFSASPLFSVQLILMDMQMPVMDGCQAAAAIRKLDRPDGKKVPIIAVTANAFAEDIARTTQAGMNDHLAKPIDFGQLEEKIQNLCRKPTPQNRETRTKNEKG